MLQKLRVVAMENPAVRRIRGHPAIQCVVHNPKVQRVARHPVTQVLLVVFVPLASVGFAIWGGNKLWIYAKDRKKAKRVAQLEHLPTDEVLYSPQEVKKQPFPTHQISNFPN